MNPSSCRVLVILPIIIRLGDILPTSADTSINIPPGAAVGAPPITQFRQVVGAEQPLVRQAATAAVLQAVCSHFGWPKLLPKLEVDETQRPFNAGLSISDLAKTYDIRKDSLALKAQPYALEQLRSHYTYRHDWQAYEFGNRKLSIQDPLG